jgi:hypothetical protein
MTTAAGVCSVGFGGDNGPATVAQLSTPSPPHHPRQGHEHLRRCGQPALLRTRRNGGHRHPEQATKDPAPMLQGTCPPPQSATCPCAALPQRGSPTPVPGATSPPQRVVRRVPQTWPVRPVWCRTRQPLHREVKGPGGASDPARRHLHGNPAGKRERHRRRFGRQLTAYRYLFARSARRAPFAHLGDRRHAPHRIHRVGPIAPVTTGMAPFVTAGISQLFPFPFSHPAAASGVFYLVRNDGVATGWSDALPFGGRGR